MKLSHAFLLFAIIWPSIILAKEEKLFLGQPFEDSNQLYYFQQRYYNPQTTHFNQIDPLLRALPNENDLEKILANPQRLNSYSYALNNPVSNSDRTGLSSVSKTRQESFDKISAYIRWDDNYWLIRDRDGNESAIDAIWQKSLELNKGKIGGAFDTFYDALHIDWRGQNTLDRSEADFIERRDNLPNALTGEWGGNRFNQDKLQHFAASARLNYKYGSFFTAALGHLKEIQDGVRDFISYGPKQYSEIKQAGGGYSKTDIAANRLGIFWSNEYLAGRNKPSFSIKMYTDSFPF